jgi:hypothetical protein
MHAIRLPVALVLLGLLACGGERHEGGGTPADTSRDRPDSTKERRPSPTDTVDGASPQDTLRNKRPLGMQRPGGYETPADKARQDSEPKRE